MKIHINLCCILVGCGSIIYNNGIAGFILAKDLKDFNRISLFIKTKLSNYVWLMMKNVSGI